MTDEHNVTHLGQVFTPPKIVEQMLSLRRNRGRTLEPSAGNGAFSRHLDDDAVCIELDARVAPPGTRVMDFFTYPVTEKFDTVIGNPPYVRFQDIPESTRKQLDERLFDGRSNLYLFFIEKCIRHLKPGGELIFIVPREFIKLTAARRLNRFIFEQGTITDFFETGDSSIFGAYVPNCAIFRFERGRMERHMHDGRRFALVEGQLMFLSGHYSVPLGSLFDVRVGAVSGADDIFTHPDGNMDFVCSRTAETGRTRRMLYGIRHPALEPHRERLLRRRVRRFDDNNWWLWGRQHCITDAPRIYVNAKTRRRAPFFLHECRNYDGSILALFPKRRDLDLVRATELLNHAVNWDELGFVCDGRYLFSQRSLQTSMLPEAFAELAHIPDTSRQVRTQEREREEAGTERSAL